MPAAIRNGLSFSGVQIVDDLNFVRIVAMSMKDILKGPIRWPNV
jgi:hypothetical protein